MRSGKKCKFPALVQARSFCFLNCVRFRSLQTQSEKRLTFYPAFVVSSFSGAEASFRSAKAVCISRLPPFPVGYIPSPSSREDNHPPQPHLPFAKHTFLNYHVQNGISDTCIHIGGCIRHLLLRYMPNIFGLR